MRYVLSVGEDENGPVVAGEDGTPVVFVTHESACTAARALLQNSASAGLPEGAGVFVLKLLPTAMYLPVAKVKDQTIVDETVIYPEKKDDDNEQN